MSDKVFRYHIDHPTSWSTAGSFIFIRGWCFGADGNPIGAVRLQTGDLIFQAAMNLPRPDVKSSLVEAPNDHTGFEIRGVLPTGTITISIEAQAAEGEWSILEVHLVCVKQRIFPRWMGRSSLDELIFSQVPTQMSYPPRELRLEKFPPNASTVSALKFQIVTPSFQQARFIAETMQSVLQQTDVVCDYFVKDGGSTDGSVELINRQFDAQNSSGKMSPLHSFSWASSPDKGQTDAIAQSFGKNSLPPSAVMAWINSDDFYLPGALSYVADYFLRHPEVDVLYGHRIVVDENSQEIARWFLPKHSPEVLRRNDFVPQETLFWRRRIWDKVGGLDPAFAFAMDWDLLLRFQEAGARIVRVPYFLACFRLHPAQKTSAAMNDVGAQEITRLRTRANGRIISAAELEEDPVLLRYLRRSAFIQFLWKLGFRSP